LIHVYCTSHGYSFSDDKDNASQILLNAPISFCNSAKVFKNPYPIEKQLEYIFNKFANVNIVLIADMCREPNRWIKKLNPEHKDFKELKGLVGWE
jgi:hypothetical protein